MQIIIESTGDVITVSAFYESHPTIAFAQPLTDEVLIDYGARIYVPPPSPITISDVQRAVQDRLDNWARERNYDGILSVCTYATSAVSKFAAEAATAVAARDATWGACYALLAEIESGSRPMPATVEDVLALLPELTWSEE